ncbi:MAG: hypothetical protein WBE60_06450 [Nitrosotalea sp.]
MYLPSEQVKNKKIILATFSAFVIAFSIFFIVLFSIQYKTVDGHLIITDPDTYLMEKNFYSEKISTAEKKIFILGSSHVMPLNTTTIQEYLLEANQNYTIYNLAVGSDHPIERLATHPKTDHLVNF